jgi:protein YIPF6
LKYFFQLRDVRAVAEKFKHVLYPKEKNSLNILKEWDLWGPLVLCTFMATILQGSSDDKSNDGGPEFAEVFVIVWIGAVVVTLNSKLLGGNM